ncbi:MAG: hypothetical protein KKD74_02765 [Bacteroidetes bacterium]|nr:hypothetical protein [Bacteroidota bacterium]
MKHITSLSLAVLAVIVTAFAYSLSQRQLLPLAQEADRKPAAVDSAMVDAVDIAYAMEDELMLYKRSKSLDTSMVQALIVDLKKTIASQQQPETANIAKADAVQQGQPVDLKFLFKMMLSALFTIASLYVVLSNKYDQETKKWAFSMLSLIAGIWIGTV